MYLGKNIQYLRKQRKITQEGFSEQMAVSRQTVAKWEAGDAVITIRQPFENTFVKQAGAPVDRAKRDLENPIGMLKRYSDYFDSYNGVKIANICGSCGKKAVPLAILGAEVTVFDISEDNKKYALEVATAAEADFSFVHAGCSSNFLSVKPLSMTELIISLIVYFL